MPQINQFASLMDLLTKLGLCRSVPIETQLLSAAHKKKQKKNNLFVFSHTFIKLSNCVFVFPGNNNDNNTPGVIIKTFSGLAYD